MDFIRLLTFRLSTQQRGQTMAEYAILLGVIALVVIVAAVFLGGGISTIFSSTARKV